MGHELLTEGVLYKRNIFLQSERAPCRLGKHWMGETRWMVQALSGRAFGKISTPRPEAECAGAVYPGPDEEAS